MNNLEELCPYIFKCSQDVNPRILDLRCGKDYERCTIYQRFKVLENMPLRNSRHLRTEYKLRDVLDLAMEQV